MKMKLRLFAVFVFFLVAPLLRAQVWVTVAPESTTISVALPAGATYRLGDTLNNKWSASVTVAAATTINPTAWPGGQYPFPDPDPEAAKVFQVLEIGAAQVVTVTDTSVTPALVTTDTIPGTAAPAPPVTVAPASIPVPAGQVYIVTLSNISIVPGSVDAMVFSPTSGMVPLGQLIGTLLSGIQMNLTIDGVTMLCSFGQTFTNGTSNLICAIPTAPSQ